MNPAEQNLGEKLSNQGVESTRRRERLGRRCTLDARNKLQRGGGIEAPAVSLLIVAIRQEVSLTKGEIKYK